MYYTADNVLKLLHEVNLHFSPVWQSIRTMHLIQANFEYQKKLFASREFIINPTFTEIR